MYHLGRAVADGSVPFTTLRLSLSSLDDALMQQFVNGWLFASALPDSIPLNERSRLRGQAISNLVCLDLSRNKVNDMGAKAVGQLIRDHERVCPLLRNVDLSSNDIGNEGAVHLAEALSVPNVRLDSLMLFSNHHIGLTGRTAFANALIHKNTWITKLDLSVGDQGALKESCQIEYYCILNRAGRRYWGDVKIPLGLWPHILSPLRLNVLDSELYYLYLEDIGRDYLFSVLKERPDIFKRQCASNGSAADMVAAISCSEVLVVN